MEPALPGKCRMNGLGAPSGLRESGKPDHRRRGGAADPSRVHRSEAPARPLWRQIDPGLEPSLLIKIALQVSLMLPTVAPY